jgi:ferredoxin
MTCGDSIGNATYYCEKVTGLQFMIYMGVRAIEMPECYVAKFNVPPVTEQEMLISAAERRIPWLVKTIKDGESFPKPDGKQATGLMHEISTPLFYQIAVKDKRFRSTDKCTGCGECVKACPLNNITLEDRKLKFNGNCTHCMACISICPEKAIEYGRRTVGKPRYYLRKSAPGLTPDILVKPVERPPLEEPADGSGDEV